MLQPYGRKRGDGQRATKNTVKIYGSKCKGLLLLVVGVPVSGPQKTEYSIVFVLSKDKQTLRLDCYIST